MPTLRSLLILRECRGGKPSLVVYPDSLKKPTVGIGHRVVPADKLNLKDQIDEARVNAFFAADTKTAVAAAKSQAAKAGIKNGQFIIYLASVNFQLGPRWYTKHKKTWALIMQGDYAGAAQELAKSTWAKQSKVRVKDFQKALLSLPSDAKTGAASKETKPAPGR